MVTLSQHLSWNVKLRTIDNAGTEVNWLTAIDIIFMNDFQSFTELMEEGNVLTVNNPHQMIVGSILEKQ